MKRTFTIILLLSVLVSCQKKIELPINAKLIAKYVVFNDSISSKILKDLKNVKEFDNKNKLDKVPFKLDGKFYKFETEYRLEDGKLITYHEHIYNSFKYSDYGIKKIVMSDNVRENLGKTFSLKFSVSREQIIDCKDTLQIEKVYPKEKLIFVKPERNDGRVNIYEYN
jgi:hypothetical protein